MFIHLELAQLGSVFVLGSLGRDLAYVHGVSFDLSIRMNSANGRRQDENGEDLESHSEGMAFFLRSNGAPKRQQIEIAENLLLPFSSLYFSLSLRDSPVSR